MNYWEWYEDFKKSGRDIFEYDGEIAWDACKSEILKILRQSHQNLDLSIDNCDEWYIKKIEEEI